MVEAAGIEPASEDGPVHRSFSGRSPCLVSASAFAHGQAGRREHGSAVGSPSPCVGATRAGVSDALRQTTRQSTGDAPPF